jgi:pimeloyl-ACP methyl ester carboxylesterase
LKLYPKSWQGFAYATIRIVAVVYVILLIAMFFAQERLIFFPVKLPPNYKFKFASPFEEKYLEVDGAKINSLLFKVPKSKGLILYFHGNAGNLESWGEVAQELAIETKMSVWIMDYPGFGKSEGEVTSENQLHDVATAFMKSATELTKDANRIVVYGRSIGTGLAANLAAKFKPGALVLESPYFSLQSMAEENYFWAPLFLLKYTFRSDEFAPDITCPVLIFHGIDDEIIPFEQGKRLAGIIKSSSLVPIHLGHHNDLGEFPEYWLALKQFLSQL